MYKYILILLVCLLPVACTQDFEEINTNQNEPETVSAALLLPTVIFDYADLAVNQNFSFGDIVGQFAANYEFNSVDIYDWTSDDRFWGIYGILQDVKDIERYGQETNDKNYEAIGIILRSYGISILTDVYGDVPYSEATRADEGIFAPVYDSQESIYNTLMGELKRASDLIDEDETVDGDILFKGSMNAWKRFANSLRLRMLLRSSEAQDNSAAMQEIVDNPARYPLLDNNEDNAVYEYSGSLPDLSPYSAGRGRDYDYFLGIPTNHVINILSANNDPRLQVWFDPKPTTSDFIGTGPGQDLANVGRPNDFSTKGASFFNESDKISAIFMT
ncbi:MAG: SusD/RagB family nutrient-binding outer membrane lipoprotein, partial [Bacteroidota bacterium]